MSFLGNIKKGLMGEESDYEDEYIDDAPQMVNNNSGAGVDADEEADDQVEGNRKKGKVVNINATQGRSGQARAL